MKGFGILSLVASLVLGTTALTVIHTQDIADSAVTNPKIAAGVAATKIHDGSVDNTEFGYLNGVTSGIQAQLDGKGAVASVGLSLPGELNVSGSPVTGSGTLSASWASELQNRAFVSPNGSSGTPTFRALVAADLPSDAAYLDAAQTWAAVQSFPTGDVKLTSGTGAIQLTASPGSGALRAVNFPDLAGDVLLSAGSQTIGGLKSWTDQSFKLLNPGATFGGTIVATNESSNHTYTLPNATGTLALTTGSSSITTVGTIASGTWNGTAVGTAYGGTGVDLSAAGGTTKLLAEDASHVISARDLVAGDLPNHSAALITSGALALARGGTGVDLSASGGTSQVLKQDASHVVSAGQLAASDLSNSTTGSDEVVLKTSPTLVTPTLGAATATTINKVTLTTPASASTLTIANGKTFTASNTLTLTGTDSSSVAFGAGGTVAYTGADLSQFASTSSATLASLLSDKTGTAGLVVFDTSPTLKTPVLGVATATSINKVAFTAPASGSTLTIDDGFTLHATGNVTALSGSSTGANTGDQTITLTGDVTGTGTGSFAATIGNAKVSNAMLAGSIDLTTKVTGVLPIANGGTGTATGSVDGWTYLIQAADQSVSSTLTVSNTFTFSVTSGKIYIVDMTCGVASGSTGDFIWNIDLSDGTSTMNGFCQFQTATTALGVGNAIVNVGAVNTFAANQACGTPADITQPVPFRMLYTFKASGTTTFRFKFGTTGYSSVMKGGSVLRYKQMD